MSFKTTPRASLSFVKLSQLSKLSSTWFSWKCLHCRASLNASLNWLSFLEAARNKIKCLFDLHALFLFLIIVQHQKYFFLREQHILSYQTNSCLEPLPTDSPFWSHNDYLSCSDWMLKRKMPCCGEFQCRAVLEMKISHFRIMFAHPKKILFWLEKGCLVLSQLQYKHTVEKQKVKPTTMKRVKLKCSVFHVFVCNFILLNYYNILVIYIIII